MPPISRSVTTQDEPRSSRQSLERSQPPPFDSHAQLSFLRRRSKIVEILSADDVVFALTLSGVCAAFRGRERIAFLNTTPDEVIRSLFYNKTAHSLITVSVYREDNFASLKCRNTHVEYIIRGQPDAGFPIFTSECLKWPGFVEFDDVNSKVLTYSAQDQSFRVWDMANYEPLYTIPGEDVTEVKISPGIMLLIHARQGGYVPLKIVSVEDGSVVKSFNHLLVRTKKVGSHGTPHPVGSWPSDPTPHRCGTPPRRSTLSSSSTRCYS